MTSLSVISYKTCQLFAQIHVDVPKYFQFCHSLCIFYVTFLLDYLQDELENPFDDRHELHDEILNSETEELPEVFPVVDLASPTCIREIVVHRSNVLKSMISEFSANDILQCNLIFVYGRPW